MSFCVGMYKYPATSTCILCLSDEFSLFQLIFIVRSYVVLLKYCPRLGEGWNPADMIYVCACPKSGAFNSVVVVCLCVTYLFFVHFLYINSYLNCFTFVILGHFIVVYLVRVLLIVEGHTVT